MRQKSDSHKYQQLADQVRSQIADGLLKPGDRLPTFEEMRARHKLGQATWEHMNAILEQEGLIRREPGAGIFVTKPPRAGAGCVGFILRDSVLEKGNSYFQAMLEGVQEGASRGGRRLLLISRDQEIDPRQVDGVLAQTPFGLPYDLPCVGLLSLNPGMTNVVADDFGGSAQAVRHLVVLGHRRIGLLTVNTHEPVLCQRAAGYQLGLAEAGIEPDMALVRKDELSRNHHDYLQWGRDAMRAWLKQGWRELGCTAICVQNDGAALGMMASLQEAGISVPQQVSVIGFDGSDICDYPSPRLTSIAVPFYKIGLRGAELLLQQIEGQRREPETITLPTTIKPGESTAPPPDCVS